jgi:hypothetical protein
MKDKEVIVNAKLRKVGESGDGKRAFVAGTTNGVREDVRIEFDTDDCDGAFVRKFMNRVIACVNACSG